MVRQKATIYLDPDIRAATKLAAVTGHKSESDIVEEALRRYLRTDEAIRGREELRELMDRVAARFDMSEDEAMALAVDEVRAHRAEKRQAQQA
jgi:Arc/MetJ family transcription regulator